MMKDLPGTLPDPDRMYDTDVACACGDVHRCVVWQRNRDSVTVFQREYCVECDPQVAVIQVLLA